MRQETLKITSEEFTTNQEGNEAIQMCSML
jgi:hypothetical protein